MRKILVTGAAGFIGFHLSRRLLKDGDAVFGLDNLNDYYDVSLKQARLKAQSKQWKMLLRLLIVCFAMKRPNI